MSNITTLVDLPELPTPNYEYIKEYVDDQDAYGYDVNYYEIINYRYDEKQQKSLDSHRDFVNKTNSDELNNIMSEFDNL